MDSFNPIEWLAWLYGKLFLKHGVIGGIVVVIIFGALGLVLWIRAVDKFNEEHESPKLQAATRNNPSPQTSAAQQQSAAQTPMQQQSQSRSQAQLEKPRQRTKSLSAPSPAGATPQTPQSTQPPMSQECGTGANCAMSNNQQGGITAGQINIGTPPPSQVQLVCISRNQPRTYVNDEGTKRTPIQGFESKYKVRITGQEVPQVDIQIRSSPFVHIDCDRLVNGTGWGTGGTSSTGTAGCTFEDLHGEIGLVTVFTATELPENESFLGYRCLGTPCNVIKPTACQ